MDLDQAYEILNYQVKKNDSEENLRIIKVMGYTKLRGGKSLTRCSDQQIYRVANRLFKKAEKLAQQEASAIKREEQESRYYSFLCEINNVSETAGQDISELESQLMQ